MFSTATTPPLLAAATIPGTAIWQAPVGHRQACANGTTSLQASSGTCARARTTNLCSARQRWLPRQRRPRDPVLHFAQTDYSGPRSHVGALGRHGLSPVNQSGRAISCCAFYQNSPPRRFFVTNVTNTGSKHLRRAAPRSSSVWHQLVSVKRRTAFFSVSALRSSPRCSSADISGHSTSLTPSRPTTLGNDNATP